MKITIEIKDEDLKKLMLLLGKSDIEILGIGEKDCIFHPTSPTSPTSPWPPLTITYNGESLQTFI